MTGKISMHLPKANCAQLFLWPSEMKCLGLWLREVDFVCFAFSQAFGAVSKGIPGAKLGKSRLDDGMCGEPWKLGVCDILDVLSLVHPGPPGTAQAGMGTQGRWWLQGKAASKGISDQRKQFHRKGAAVPQAAQGGLEISAVGRYSRHTWIMLSAAWLKVTLLQGGSGELPDLFHGPDTL